MKATKRPNILIIVTDQQNIDAIAAYKKYFRDKEWHCHWIKTPNLDKLVEKGYSFLESFSTNPVCSPARSSIFTGRYTIETGVIFNNVGIDKAVPNMGEWFEKHSNYTRIYCGKWHAGGTWSYPDVEGPRKIPGFDTIPVGVSGTGDFNDFQVSGALSNYIINYDKPEPFLAVAGLMNPHDICYWIPALHGKALVPDQDRFGLGDERPPLPPNFDFNFKDYSLKSQVNRTEEEWRNYLYDYQRMVEKVDSDVGRLLDAVETRSDKTLVVFTSDHGEGSARHKRVQKWYPFDEAVKVPLIFYLPGTINSNKVDSTHLVSGVDIMPTLCDFAGIPSPDNCSGKSLFRVLQGTNEQNRFSTAFMEFLYTGMVVRHGDYKYVKMYEYSENKEKPFVRLSDGQAEYFTPGRGRGRYRESGTVYLFDMKNDPWEINDLSKDAAYAETLKKMDDILANEFESRIIPGKNYDRN